MMMIYDDNDDNDDDWWWLSNDHQVQLMDGYFVHFVAPENLPPMPKHVIFVLDTSGRCENRHHRRKALGMVIFSDFDEFTGEKNSNRSVFTRTKGIGSEITRLLAPFIFFCKFIEIRDDGHPCHSINDVHQTYETWRR